VEYNIKIYNQELRCEDMYCIYMAQDREKQQDLVNAVRKTSWQILTRKAIDLAKDSA
jgi:hypothetical protein